MTAPGRVVAVGSDTFVHLQLPGSWGYSNSGWVASGDEAVVIDTCFDLRGARAMLAACRAVRPAALIAAINTHADGDHCFGNQLLGDVPIVGSRAAACELRRCDPAVMRAFIAASAADPVLGPYVARIFGDFDLDGIDVRPPTVTFTGTGELTVGRRQLQLIEVGPAHTDGDVIVLLPDVRVAFVGDLVFAGAYPVAWTAPLARWVDALRLVEGLDVDVLVPGHGPPGSRLLATAAREHLERVTVAASACHRRGMLVEQAIDAIAAGEPDGWRESERLAATVAAAYREADGDPRPPSMQTVFAELAAYDCRLAAITERDSR